MTTRFPNFEKLINDWDPVLRRAFLDAINNLKNRAQINKIIERLSVNDIEGALRAVGLDQTAFRGYDQTYSNAFEKTANAVVDAFPILHDVNGFRVNFNFNMRNLAAERYLADHSSQFVQQILDDQRTMIRNTLRAGLTIGDNPRDTALGLVGRISRETGKREGGMIGLTDSQAQWVLNYRAELQSDNPVAALDRTLRDRRFDKMVRRAAANNERLTTDQIDMMVTAYQNRALRYRAEAIARTETMAALHEAQQQSIEQAIQNGTINPEAVTFIWRTAEDARVRDSHAAMDGQERALGEMFVTGDGNLLEYPGDPNGPPEEIINCRCWREPSVDFLQGIE